MNHQRFPATVRYRRRGYTLIEALTVATMMGIMTALAAPSFQRALEQSKADIAVANLRAIWSAERFYWFANRQYSDSLDELVTEGLLDASLTSAGTTYTYSVTTDPDNMTFTATATRINSSYWTGSYSINERGQVTGSVGASGEADLNLIQ